METDHQLTSAQSPKGRSPGGGEASVPMDLNHRSDDTYAFPVSPVQERIWHTYKAQPHSPVYNGAFRMNLAGPLDPRILAQSFEEIIRRHEVLRATIEEIDGQPMQVIAPSLAINVAISDLRQVPGERRESELHRLSRQEAQHPFALERGPLIRVGLVRMEDQRHVLLLTIHQIICDGWSIGLIMEELQKIYAAFTQGLPDPLPPLSIQFADYLVWKQEMGNRPEFQNQLGYWKRKLSHYQRLEITPDLPAPHRESPDAVIISHLLPRSLTDRLRDLSNAQGGTFFITSLAAFFAFLRRLTGLSDLAVGSPLAGRGRTDLEGLIGQFVNHIVYRAEIDGDPTFLEFLPSVREMVWETFSNQDVPFESVIKALSPGTDTIRNPFFLVNFICQREYGRASTFNFDFADIRMSTMPSESQGALYDLNFFLVEREVGWRLSLEYKSRLYSQESAKALLDGFKGVLESIASSFQRKLSELPLPHLPEHLAKMAQTTSAGQEVYAMPASPVQRRFWLLSQIEQDNPSFHMAAALRITGPLRVSALEQSFQCLVARHETLRTTFEEIDREIVQVISPLKSFPVPVVDLQATPEAEREQLLQPLIGEESSKPFDLAKGPLFRAVLFALKEDEAVLLTTIHHILADGWSNRVIQEELWSNYEYLAHGRGPSFTPLKLQYSDYATWLADWLESPEAKEHLDFWSKQLEGELPIVNFPTDRPPSLRPASHGAIETLLLPPGLTHSLKDFAQAKGTTLFTILLAAFGVLLSRSSQQTDIIVGAPVANRREETERLIGPFAGPICLRLDFSGSPTLDQLLRRVHDLNLNVLGHSDLPFEVLMDRIKMRTVNGRRPIFQFYFFYQNAFVQPRQVGQLEIAPLATTSLGIPFELQLGMIERAEGIRAQLEYNPDLFNADTIRLALADYKRILESFISEPDLSLEAITVSRTASAMSGYGHRSVPTESLPPQTDTERKLAEVWEDVLSVQPIGRNKDYFELGGNSLLAVRLFAEIERVFLVHLPISTLFYTRTIAEFAQLLDNQQAGRPSWSSVVPIQSNGSRVPFFCVHGAGGNVLIYRALSRHLGPDQPFYGLQSQGLNGKRPPLESVEEMAAHYVVEIQKVQSHGPYYLGGYCLGGTIALEVAQKLLAQGEQVALVAMFDTVNGARIRPRKAIDRWRRHVERVLFHVQNFLLLDLLGKRRFLAEKLQVTRSRTAIWKGSLLSILSRNRLVANSHSQVLARLWNTNDLAYVAYQPKPYWGRICDFRPKKQYSFYLECGANWDGIALGPMDVTYLPVYPAGMLLEPFVKDLAVALRAAIDRADEDIRSRKPG